MATSKGTSKRGARSTPKNVSEIVAEVTQTPVEDEKTKKVRASYKERAVTDSAGLTVEKVTQSLTKAGLDINKTLNSVRELFESEIAALQTIKEAIEAKQEELEELFSKEVVASSLRDLVLQHEARKTELAKAEEDARKAWAIEQANHAAEQKDRNEKLAKERAREHEEYEYSKVIARRNEETAWKLQAEKRAREQKATEEGLEKAWREREEALKKTETEVAAAKNKLDNFDALVKAEVDKNVAIISNTLKSKHETEARIAKLEFDSTQKLLAHDNDILKATVAAKDKEIQALRLALEKKDSEVKEVAVAAMNAQSGKQALAAVQETVQNQNSKK